MKLRMMPVVLCALALVPCRVVASEQNAETLLVDHLLEISAFKESVIALVGRNLPPDSTASDLAVIMMRNDEQAWKALRSDLPGLLKGRLSPERLQDLARLYGENAEQEWGRSGEEMVALVKALATEDTSFRKIVGRQACSVGLLAPNIDRAREKAGKTGRSKLLEMPPEVYAEVLQPMLRPVAETCDCILQRGFEAFGEKFVSGELSKEERDNFVKQLFLDGKCPDPFAAPGDGA